jgi:uncharacterized protein with HEPN domain
MYKTTHKDFACILNILDSIAKIENYSHDFSDADSFYEDTKSFDAVMMNFVVIGEMAEKLSVEFIENTGEEIKWPRNKRIKKYHSA